MIFLFMRTNAIKWNDAMDVFADDAPKMLGCCSGFQTLAEKFKYNKEFHCFML